MYGKWGVYVVNLYNVEKGSNKYEQTIKNHFGNIRYTGGN